MLSQNLMGPAQTGDVSFPPSKGMAGGMLGSDSETEYREPGPTYPS